MLATAQIDTVGNVSVGKMIVRKTHSADENRYYQVNVVYLSKRNKLNPLSNVVLEIAGVATKARTNYYGYGEIPVTKPELIDLIYADSTILTATYNDSIIAQKTINLINSNGTLELVIDYETAKSLNLTRQPFIYTKRSRRTQPQVLGNVGE